METKFRLSPRIDAVLSQRLEDRSRDKLKKTYNLRNNRGEVQRVPSTESTIGNTFSPKDLSKDQPKDKEKSKETNTSGRMPYVEVPPIRPSLNPMTGPVKPTPLGNINQLPTEGSKYKVRAPVEAGLDIEKIVESVLDLEINLPLRSLAGASGAIQREIKKQMTKARQLKDEAVNVSCLAERQEELKRLDSLPISCFTVMTEVSEEIPEGYFVADDPVLQYLADNKDGDPSDLLAAKASESLRAIYAHVNQVAQKECLIDNGSMIVSMAKEAATQLGLTWDPSIRINMESASSHVEKTLGLARNVCFRVGGLNLYLQVHILENPPYQILLGRPFDAFTKSVVRTAADGSSEILLTDPNTKGTAIVPTYERGVGPEDLQKQRYQGF